jgi:hypothetical protein
MEDNPWVDRFPVTWSDEDLDRIIAVPAGPLPDLDALPLDVAHATLFAAFEQLVVPSSQMRIALRRLLNRARVGAQLLYPDRRSFLARAYSLDPTPCSLPMTCITGLAGSGKTELLRALTRAFPPVACVDVAGHSRFRLVAGHVLTARACVGLGQMLEPIFPKDAPPTTKVFGAARRQLARDGASLLAADELQFVTQSKSGAQVTNLLLRVERMGPPACYVTNFSLVHRLDARPHEQRDRLLSDPLILVPDACDSDDWMALLMACFAVHPVFSALAALTDIGVEMQLRTYALKRNVPKLLALTYCAAREDGATSAAPRHLQRAYLSLAYASARKDVEILLTSRISASFDGRADLWCPLTGTDMFAPAVREQSPPKDTHAEALGQAALVESMTADESKHLKAVTKEVGVPTKPERVAHPKVTAANLAAGARALSDKRKRGSGGAAA